MTKPLRDSIQITSDGRFAYDAYRRFIQLFGKIALGVDEKEFDQILNKVKEKTGAVYDTDLDADSPQRYLQTIPGSHQEKERALPFPRTRWSS